MGLVQIYDDFKNGLKLARFLMKAVKDKRFFPKDNKTFCGQFGLTCLDELGYDIFSIIKEKGIWWTNVSMSYDLAIANKVLQISPVEAQKRANQGIAVYVLSKRNEPYNHGAIVFPTMKKYNFKKGVRLAQAGGVNGIFWINDWQAWGDRWQDSRIKYFVLEKKK